MSRCRRATAAAGAWLLGRSLAERAATDPRCPAASCCVQGAHADCWRLALWTAAYCCPEGPAADCYRWGKDAPGHDLAAYVLSSGVQCRHLCQAREGCAYWTYIVDVPQVGEQRGRCYLKAEAALEAQVAAHPYVVSGERLCRYFQEGLSAAEARARQGFEAVPWRTSPEGWRGAGASALRYPLLPSAGTREWLPDAASAFDSLGFVAILGALNTSQVRELRASAWSVADRILAQDPLRMGNRGPRRYSFGAVSKTLHLMHVKAWPQLLDNDAVGALLSAVYPEGYLAAGGGGDFVLGDTSTYQSLHLDIGGGPIYDPGPPPGVGVNYLVDDLSCADAPMRVVPGTHRLPAEPPPLTFESREAKAAVLCPLPAGTALVRDLRAWHGGTPNGAARARLLPNAEFVSLAWGQSVCRPARPAGQSFGQQVCGSGTILDPCSPVLPASAHARLTPRGRAVTAGIVDATGVIEQAAASGEWMHDQPVDFMRHLMEAY